MALRRLLLVHLVAGTAAGLLTLAVTGDPEPGPPSAPAVGRPVRTVPEPGSVGTALEVLHQWDRRRAAAYAEGDPRALRALYLPGSVAGSRDARLLRSYAAHGLVVVDMAMQVVSVELLARRPHRIRLRVRDRLHGAVAAAPEAGSGVDAHHPLPADGFTTRVLTLVHRAGRWRVAAVRSGRV